MMKQTTHIKVEHLTVKYQFHTAIKDVTFEIQKGDFVGVIGENGSGKTTLIKALLGALDISSGNITFMDDLKVGYLPQHIMRAEGLFPATAEEVALMGLLEEKRFPKRFTKDDKAKVERIFHELGIMHLLKKRIGNLSGGQQQRVMLARALISDPDVLILDEPTSALDSVIEQTFLDLLKSLNEEKETTIILITHDLATVGEYIDHVIYLNQVLEYDGPFDEFCKNTKHSPYIHLHAKSACGHEAMKREMEQ
ncbi:MAG: metal ABC transporter ATP-binding protein [Candidatus Izemoplasmataceae bacterium]